MIGRKSTTPVHPIEKVISILSYTTCGFVGVLWLLIGYFAIAYTAMHYLDITCVFLKIFGIPCPGCGMTRAFLSLLKPDFYSAAKYNILIYFMPYVFMYMFFLVGDNLVSSRFWREGENI